MQTREIILPTHCGEVYTGEDPHGGAPGSCMHLSIHSLIHLFVCFLKHMYRLGSGHERGAVNTSNKEKSGVVSALIDR